jgi:hypothetical protein
MQRSEDWFGKPTALQSTTIVVVNFPEMGYFLEQENGHKQENANEERND